MRRPENIKPIPEKPPLNINALKTGPENVNAGIDLETAEELASRVSIERGIGLLKPRVIINPNARNTLNWIMEIDGIGGDWSGLEKDIFITDKTSGTFIFSTGESLRGIRYLGSYILIIPPEGKPNSEVQLIRFHTRTSK